MTVEMVGKHAVQRVSVTDARSNQSELMDRIEEGGSIEITRRGKPVARRTSLVSTLNPIDIATLRALTTSMPPQAQSAADLVRAMRDSDRA